MNLEALMELGIYSNPRQLRWEAVPAASARAPTAREEAIVDALSSSFSVLSSPQIAQRFLPDAVPRTVRKQLRELAAQGWVRRAHLVCAGPGQTPRLFGARGAHIDACGAVRALHANAWFFAFERLVEGAVARVCEEADLAIEVAGTRWLVEIGAWRRSVRELLYRHERGTEAVIYVLPDERTAISFARYADRVLEVARERCCFVAERDIHLGRLRGLVVDGGIRLSTIAAVDVCHGR
jgi:hypothetical protein